MNFRVGDIVCSKTHGIEWAEVTLIYTYPSSPVPHGSVGLKLTTDYGYILNESQLEWVTVEAFDDF